MRPGIAARDSRVNPRSCWNSTSPGDAPDRERQRAAPARAAPSTAQVEVHHVPPVITSGSSSRIRRAAARRAARARRACAIAPGHRRRGRPGAPRRCRRRRARPTRISRAGGSVSRSIATHAQRGRHAPAGASAGFAKCTSPPRSARARPRSRRPRGCPRRSGSGRESGCRPRSAAARGRDALAQRAAPRPARRAVTRTSGCPREVAQRARLDRRARVAAQQVGVGRADEEVGPEAIVLDQEGRARPRAARRAAPPAPRPGSGRSAGAGNPRASRRPPGIRNGTWRSGDGFGTLLATRARPSLRATRVTIALPPMGQRILVVDDEPDLLELVRVNLSQAGYEVETAETGAAGARARCADRAPDLMMLDLMLPDLSGTELCRASAPGPALARDPDHHAHREGRRGRPRGRARGRRRRLRDQAVQPARAHPARARGAAPAPAPAARAPRRCSSTPRCASTRMRHRCFVEQAEIVLTAKEFQLLLALMTRPGPRDDARAAARRRLGHRHRRHHAHDRHAPEAPAREARRRRAT